MARAILVIDVQKVYTNPASPLYCLGNADVMANVNAITAAAETAGNLVVHIRLKAGTAATLSAGFARVMTAAEWLVTAEDLSQLAV